MVSKKEDIQIKVGLELATMMKQIDKLNTYISAFKARASRQLAEAMAPISAPAKGGAFGIQKEDLTFLANAGRELNQLASTVMPKIAASSGLVEAGFARIGDSVLRSQKSQQQYWDNYFANSDNAIKLTDDTGKAVDDAQKPFAGYALSIMFFGMAMQRVFGSIAKSGIKTFQDVMHSTEGSVTSFDMLNSSVKYLGFNIGQALEPVISFLIPIIDAVAEWAAENPRLVATITTLGFVLGGLFTAGGMMKLALDGFSQLGDILAKTKVGKGLAGISLTSPWVIAIIAVAAALTAFTAAIKSDEEATEAAKKSWEGLKEPLDTLKESLLEIVNNIFDSEIALEDFAWVAAWVFNILTTAIGNGIDKVTALIEIFSMLINAIKLVANAYRGLWYSTTFRFAKAKEIFEDAKENMDALAKDAKDFWGLITGDFEDTTLAAIMQGPQGYREQYENTQTSIYFGEVNVAPQPGESSADVINRILQEQGVTN